MPKEHRKRGRREEKKRKREEEADFESAKRRKSDVADDDVERIFDLGRQAEHVSDLAPSAIPFYGMLDDDEQEYFKQADTMLELDQFPSAEERELFLANVYREANGKELKIANSQSCSRLMERLILMSTSGQLKELFQKFVGHFLYLVQHRFASHCCETLFTRAAAEVTEELTAPMDVEQPRAENGKPYVSMESLFLLTLGELEDNLGYLMTDQFASHALRLLLVVLSGKPIADASTKSLMKSKKSEDIGSSIPSDRSNRLKSESRTVPSSFNDALEKTMSRIVSGLEATYLRALATHPTANPVLQLLLELEISKSGKPKAKDPDSLLRKLLPDDPPKEGTDSATFVNGLIYDPVGSRLIETIIEYAPGKTFRALYRGICREKLPSLAKNDIACYPVTKAIERLSKEELQYAVEQLSRNIRTLVERSRTSVIRALIERCRIREVDTQPIITALQDSYGSEPADAMIKMLGMSAKGHEGVAPDRQAQIEDRDVGKVHGSLLAQTMLELPGPMRDMVMDGLISMDALTLQEIAKDRSATHVLQFALRCPNQDHAAKFRRTIVQRLAPHAVELALDTTASHVVDAMHQASQDLRYPREQVGAQLAKSEGLLRQFPSGKAVWRNWEMDLYKRSRQKWIHQDSIVDTVMSDLTSKEGKSKGRKEREAQLRGASRPKTALDLARERHAAGLPPPRKASGQTSTRDFKGHLKTALSVGQGKT
ncbi:MAG: hypothetical protein Q9191_004368 [Dirinaria sp. TL-2023a]